MLSKNGFNLWADNYDECVKLSEDANDYPFAGYKNVLNEIYNIVRTNNGNKVLDIGFGTAVLTTKLYNDNYKIFGIDFSNKMIEIAQNKMPKATLIQYDFSKGLPNEILNENFDFIISTYAIHHLNDAEKTKFINMLLSLLNDNGKIILGDVAFSNANDLEICRKNSKDKWDDDEIYLVFDEIKQIFPKAIFVKISHCSGVIIITK